MRVSAVHPVTNANARGVAVAAMLLVCVLAPAARADDGACVAATERGLSLRKDGKFLDALKALAACTDASCPDDVRAECTRRVEDIAAAMPTLVLGATDPTGNDLRGVKVTLDGAPITDALDGRAIKVDPGPHTFRFEAEGRISVVKDLVLREGEKDRREVVVLASEPAPVPLPSLPSAPSGARAPDRAPKPVWWTWQRSAAVVASGAGVVGLGLGALFGALAASDQSMENNNCSSSACANRLQAQEDYRTANANATASTVSFVAGGALLATGLVLLLIPRDSAARAQGSLYIAPSTALGAGAVLGGAF